MSRSRFEDRWLAAMYSSGGGKRDEMGRGIVKTWKDGETEGLCKPRVIRGKLASVSRDDVNHLVLQRVFPPPLSPQHLPLSFSTSSFLSTIPLWRHRHSTVFHLFPRPDSRAPSTPFFLFHPLLSSRARRRRERNEEEIAKVRHREAVLRKDGN